MLTRRDLVAIIGLTLIAAAAIYAIARIRALGFTTPTLPPALWAPLALTLALARVIHWLGRAKQRRADTVRFWKGRAR